MSMLASDTIRVAKGKRLVYYREAPSPGFWDRHWKPSINRGNYTSADAGYLGWFEKPFVDYLPKVGKILEAGCGTGQVLVALRQRGYDCEGVEWAEETVRGVRSIYPDLPIRSCDVGHLDVADETYGAYISLGVVEHYLDGPAPLLKEAHRVLKPQGLMCVSVPYFHSLRQRKARWGFYKEKLANQRPFYQYAFCIDEMKSILQTANFDVIDVHIYDGLKGLKDEVPLLASLLKWPWLGTFLEERLRAWQWLEQNLGHMALFVCRKSKG